LDYRLDLLVYGTVVFQKLLALLAHQRHNPSVDLGHSGSIR
jgi:hypothetical protein